VGCEGALLGRRGLGGGWAEVAVRRRVLAVAAMMVAALQQVALGMILARECEAVVAMKGS
jgi:hypothetical protein